MISKKKKGDEGEKIALDYLAKKGYQIITNNFHSKFGEIDIIAKSPTTQNLVFVEVKNYQKESLVDPKEMITPKKQRRLVTTAKYFLFVNNLENIQVQFDLIIVEDLLVKEHLENIIWL